MDKEQFIKKHTAQHHTEKQFIKDVDALLNEQSEDIKEGNYTQGFLDWKSKYFEYSPKLLEYKTKQGNHYTRPELWKRYERAMNESPFAPYKKEVKQPEEKPQGINLSKMSDKIDEVLENETDESLTKWITDKRKEQPKEKEPKKIDCRHCNDTGYNNEGDRCGCIRNWDKMY